MSLTCSEDIIKGNISLFIIVQKTKDHICMNISRKKSKHYHYRTCEEILCSEKYCTVLTGGKKKINVLLI